MHAKRKAGIDTKISLLAFFDSYLHLFHTRSCILALVDLSIPIQSFPFPPFPTFKVQSLYPLNRVFL